MKAVLLFSGLVLLLVQPVHAQGLIEGAAGAGVGGGTELGGAAQAPATQQAIRIYLDKQGYSDIGPFVMSELGGHSALQADATSPAGTPITLYLDPLTGKILSATPR
jgi:hypothetical protein